MIYWNKEVADILQIGDSTLRRWCLLLEENGYNFNKDQNNNRAFNDQDLIILRRFKEVSKTKGVTLNGAVNAILSTVERPNQTTLVHEVEHKGDENDIVQSESKVLLDKIMNKLEKQEEFNQELLKRLDQQQEYIDKNINHRDEQLMAVLREIQETKKLTAVTTEEKKSWWKWWRSGR
jgi:DNA-binding transcriptional MerR regulator